jgi:hypothetical protein
LIADSIFVLLVPLVFRSPHHPVVAPDCVPDNNRAVKITDILPGATLRRCATLIAIACAFGGFLTYFRFQQLFLEDAGGISRASYLFFRSTRPGQVLAIRSRQESGHNF